ncbi:hypothetical protein ACSQ9Q_00005, partial [Salmonella enterica]|uniref:hypothetical protein n=1 Tax=Salmonella enterica TaxID=28901 RepID=UPI003EDBA3A9
ITFSGFKSGTCQRYSGRVKYMKKARCSGVNSDCRALLFFGYKTAFNSVTIIVGLKGIKSTLATPDKRKGSCAR